MPPSCFVRLLYEKFYQYCIPLESNFHNDLIYILPAGIEWYDHNNRLSNYFGDCLTVHAPFYVNFHFIKTFLLKNEMLHIYLLRLTSYLEFVRLIPFYNLQTYLLLYKHNHIQSISWSWYSTLDFKSDFYNETTGN